MLQETWALGEIEVNGYSAHQISATPSEKRGRAKGGLLILVSTKLNIIMTKLPSLNQNAAAVKVKFNHSTIVFINVYLPPQRRNAQIERIYQDLETYIQNLLLTNDGQMIIGGDFNARLGTNDSALYAAYNLCPPDGLHFPIVTRRLFKDTVSNYAGLNLAQLVYRLDLHILNGSTSGDIPGEFSFWSGTRMSTIDYMIVSCNILNTAINLVIDSRIDSDHLPLKLYLKLQEHHTHIEKALPVNPEMILTNSRIKWSGKTAIYFTNLLNNNQFSEIHSTFLKAGQSSNVIALYETLINKLVDLADSNKSAKTHTNKRRSYNWFDKECVDAKKMVISKFKQNKNKNPSSMEVEELLQLKKDYKKLIKEKKRKAQQIEWEKLIKAVRGKDMKSFWESITLTTNNLSVRMNSYINARVWEAHFHELYAKRDNSSFHVSRLYMNLPEWHPVSVSEIKDLVNQLKIGKAPGCDGIPPELIKNNCEWWAPILANLFTYIDQNAHMPSEWGTAIIIPIYKKGKKDNPANYRPISLQPIISKLYARHLSWKLIDWMDSESVLADEQAGFRSGRSTQDHALILRHLVDKYTKKPRGSLFAAFIDLRSAFDLISRDRLWSKLESSSIDRRLLLLMYKLHENTTLRIRCNKEGQLSDKVPTYNGVKQGCILAPLLFNFYINSMVTALSHPEFHPPKLANRHISLLLYADDAVLISQTPIGLKRALYALAQYCKEEMLQINYSKTKVLVFAQRPRIYKWLIDEHEIEQIKAYKYLGVVFQYKGNHKAHVNNVVQAAQKSSLTVLKFFYSKGGQYIPAALRLFQAKSLSQLLYGAQLGPYSSSSFIQLEVVQSKFVRAILQVPRGVSNAALRFEVGYLKVEARAWLAIFNFWLKLTFQPIGLTSLVLQDNHQSPWKRAIYHKINRYGYSVESIQQMGYDKAKSNLRQRIIETERQQDLGIIRNRFTVDNALLPLKPAKYLYLPLTPKQRKALTLARFNALPSAVQDGKYNNTPYTQRLCPCNSGEIESISHVLLHCAFYSNIREVHVDPYIRAFPGRSEAHYTQLLLTGRCPGRYIGLNSDMLTKVAKFCAAAIKIREGKVPPKAQL